MPQHRTEQNSAGGIVEQHALPCATIIELQVERTIDAEDRLLQLAMSVFSPDRLWVGERIDEIDAFDVERYLLTRLGDEKVSVRKVFEKLEREQSGVSYPQLQVFIHR